MPELRKDYIIDRYVIISNERGKRPDEFKKNTQNEKQDLVLDKKCFFCPGNEHLTPETIYQYPKKILKKEKNLINNLENNDNQSIINNENNWQIRVFSNKFPAVKPQGNPIIKTDNHFFTFSDAYGHHEVIVETPFHNKLLWDLSAEELANIFRAMKLRYIDLRNDKNIKYISIFKNSGEKAGTSIKHSHCQIIAYNLIPEIIRTKEFFVKQHSHCPYCYVIDIEKNSLRKCFENKEFISFTPYASRFPFEIWILPKRHLLNLGEFSDNDFFYLADIFKKILLKLKELNTDYNFYFQYGDNIHLHIEITPRLSIQAGFELSTNTFINTISPEDAALFYRT